MNAFFAGFVFGGAFIGCLVVLFITRRRKAKHQPIDWTEQAYEPPVVTTRITMNKRKYEL